MDSCLFETTQPLFSTFFVIFSCFAIMLSVTSASVSNVFMDPRRLVKTTLIQQSMVSNLFGKSLICYNNGGVKLVRMWFDMQSALYTS